MTKSNNSNDNSRLESDDLRIIQSVKIDRLSRGEISNSNWDMLSSSEWLKLLTSRPELADKLVDSFDWKTYASATEVAQILKARPELEMSYRRSGNAKDAVLVLAGLLSVDACDCSKFDVRDWVLILRSFPELSNRFFMWSAFFPRHWVSILSVRPEFADRCHCWSSFNSSQWAQLLSSRPEFSDKCDCWSEFNVCDWVILLSNRPEFVDKCKKFKKFEGSDWAELISARPELSAKCDFSKLGGRDWALIVSAQPSFADKCEWGMLQSRDWTIVLATHPEFSDKCDFLRLNGNSWRHLLIVRPEVSEKCDWSRLNGQDWSELLQEDLSFMDRCDWEILDGSHDLSCLLQKRPELADKCDWTRLNKDGLELVRLLSEQPQFADRCDFSKFSNHWRLLKDHPEFADRWNWSGIEGYSWAELLKECPEFSQYIDNANALSDSDWFEILDVMPSLLGKCPQRRDLKKKAYAWKKLTAKHPEIKELYKNLEGGPSRGDDTGAKRPGGAKAIAGDPKAKATPKKASTAKE